MRLLNTRTFEVTQIDTDIPKYAILSHRWGDKEITFQDIQKLWARLDDIGPAQFETTLSRSRPDDKGHTQLEDAATQQAWVQVVRDVIKILAKNHPGWGKVQGACDYAANHGFEWIWIDSCCINKESSAELSEAINSMYQYYLEAAVCYVYMSDVTLPAPVTSQQSQEDVDSAFMQSQWFTRGWTLQELLAPTYLVFVDKDWKEIGTKWSLRDEISVVTSIPSRVLEDGNLDRYSIAQRMSWAADRETKRPEDQAYCLMGLFGVSMPPIYGEGGTKAFMRLQHEIIKISDDRSIFAWKAPAEDDEDRGLFARSPYEYRASGEVEASQELVGPTTGSSPGMVSNSSSFAFNNNGLQIHLPLQDLEGDSSKTNNGRFVASLHCKSQKEDKYVLIYLKQTESGGRYVRYRPSELALLSSKDIRRDLREIVVIENSLPRRSTQQSLKILPFGGSYSIGDCAGYWKNNHSEWSTDNEEAVCITYVHDSGKEYPVGFLTYPATGSTDSEDRATLIKTKSGPRRVPPLVFKSVSKAGQPGANAAVSDLDIKKTGFWAGSADRIVTRLENGDGVLYSQVHVKASHPELELTHIPLGDNRVNTLMKSLSVSSRWGWLVPSEIEGVIFENVIYPPKFFRRELKRDKQIYIPWKDHETAPDKPADAFCVLVYKLNAKMLHHYKAYVAFGHRHDKAKIFIWTDITVHGPSTSKEEIISGTFVKERKMTDSNTKTSAVYDFRAKGEGQDLSVLNVTVEERLGLERGTHLLRLGWGKENPKDCPQEKHQ